MKSQFRYIRKAFLFVLLLVLHKVQAQQYDCYFKAPVINIDFGSDTIMANLDLSPLPNYRQLNTKCPPDGNYSFISETSDCFNKDWLTFNEDHTLNDEGGKMMVVNASEAGGVFLKTTLNGFSGNTTYQFAAWMVNVCRISGGCAPLPPNITIRLYTVDGKKIAQFETGLLSQNAVLHWKKYSGMFTTPVNVSTLILIMENITLGGCGNDFALDDITFRECIQPVPSVNEEPKPVEEPVKIRVTPPVEKPVVKQTPIVTNPVKSMPVSKQPVNKDDPDITLSDPIPEKPATTLPKTQSNTIITSIPRPILTRANPVVKQIRTEPSEIIIELYDNGEIDGDTVSIYHNNELIVSRAGLSGKAIRLSVKVDAAHPHHELVMVAENLGSIPPNTSLMVITANGKRSEVFISSSEQKNAKVLIDLEQ